MNAFFNRLGLILCNPLFLMGRSDDAAEFRQRLTTSSAPEQMRLLAGQPLREARDTDVWMFTSPAESSAGANGPVRRFTSDGGANSAISLQRWRSGGLDWPIAN